MGFLGFLLKGGGVLEIFAKGGRFQGFLQRGRALGILTKGKYLLTIFSISCFKLSDDVPKKGKVR